LQRPPKKLIYGLMGLLLVYVILRSVAAAAGKSFWYDELVTLTVGSQGSLSGILTALRRPLDTQPPLFYVIEHFASRFTRNQEIAWRLPSILAFPCTLACVFLYVKRNNGEIIGFLCAIFFLTTSAFQLYAVEARPYSMLVACIAFALVCYQRAPSSLWTVLLAASLAMAESVHYLAVLSMVPFGLAETVHYWNTRKFRWPVWMALVVGTGPLLVFWNLLVTDKAYYGAHYWNRFAFSFIPWAYGDFFQTNREFGAGLAAVALAGSLGVALGGRFANQAQLEEKSGDPAEATLLFGLVALPFIAYLVTSVMHSGLTPRYILSTVLGIALAFGYVLSRARAGGVILFTIFTLSAVGVSELHFWKSVRADLNQVRTSGKSTAAFINGAGHPELRVVVPDGQTLLWLAHYAFPTSVDRFAYLLPDSPPETWADSTDKLLQVIQPDVPLRVSKFSEFTSSNSSFLLFVEEKGHGGDWVLLQLSREGWSMETVATDEWRRIYLVNRKGS
jgi:hypothetical protein